MPTGSKRLTESDSMTLSHETKFSFPLLLLFFAMSFFVGPASGADLDGSEMKQLEGLEMKYFEHTYPKEQPNARIERVEEMVFGEAKTGDDEARLAALVSAGPSKALDDAMGDGGSSSSSGGDDSSASASSQSGGAGSSSGSDSSNSDDNAGDTSEYPRVDAMEQVVFGKMFKGERIEHRLDQLEIKAFGKASTDPDLSNRTDALESYIEKKYHKNIVAMADPRTEFHYDSPVGNAPGNVRAPAYTNFGSRGDGNGQGAYGGAYGGGAPSAPASYNAPAYGGGNAPAYGTGSGAPFSGGYGGGGYGGTGAGTAGGYGGTPAGSTAGGAGPPRGATEEQQLEWLEMQVFGQVNRSAPLVDRLRTLEASVFPSEAPDPRMSIPGQISTLVNAVELMHRQPGEQQAAQGGGQPGNGQAYGAPQAYGTQQPAQAYGGSEPAYGAGSFPNWGPQGATQSGYANQNANYPVQAGQAPQQGGWPAANQFPQFPDDGSAGDPSQQGAQQTQQAQQQKHGHPLLKSLARSLMTAGAMAAPMMMGGMGGYGYGGGYGRW